MQTQAQYTHAHTRTHTHTHMCTHTHTRAHTHTNTCTKEKKQQIFEGGNGGAEDQHSINWPAVPKLLHTA